MKQVYLIFLLPYLLFLLIPIFSSVVIYNQTIDVVRKEIVSNNLSVITQTRKVLERELDEIDTTVQQLLRDTNVVQFQYIPNPFEGSAVYKTMEAQKSLLKYGFSNNFMLSYFILFKNNEVVMNSDIVYSLSEFYKQYFQYSGYDYKQWYAELLEKYQYKTYWPAKEIHIQDRSFSAIPYVNSLGYSGHFNGAIIALIDNSQIHRLLSNLDISNGGWAYIANEEGQVISSYSSKDSDVKAVGLTMDQTSGFVEQTIQKKEMMITYSKSGYNGWTYVVVQPKNLVLEKVNYIQKITILVVLASIVMGVLIAFILAHRNSRPLKRLLQMMVEKLDKRVSRGSDAYRAIEETMSRIIDNNETLEKKIQNQIPFLRAAFFERLLKSEHHTQEDIYAMLQHIGIELKGNYFNVSMFHLRVFENTYNKQMLEELDVKRVMYKEVLREAVHDNGYIHDIEEDKIAMVLMFQTDSEEQCKRLITEMAEWIQNEIMMRYHQEPVLVIGGIHSNIMDVSRSYAEAQQALNYNAQELKTGIVWYDELPKANHNRGYYYPDDVETRLMNFAKAGDLEEVTRLMNEIFRINFTERHLSPSMFKLYVNDMVGSIIKLLEQLRLDDQKLQYEIEKMVVELETSNDMSRIADGILEVWQWICKFFQKRKKSHNERMKAELMAYIHTSYHLTELNLDHVADQFHISTVYLSQFFKEQTGVNFSEYLEKIRMDMASHLLLNTDQSVNEITREVGYSSINSFGRAFKRVFGLSPTTFRRSG
jgi:two-component system, response regulator YesN